ncbi:hypothetical protein GQ53DRAFT_743444 [Thozetella sp. PMI_491]|nr:hypothetical protein GQ53DRAFT_743444 [Thozetella sp. PMI_491]
MLVLKSRCDGFEGASEAETDWRSNCRSSNLPLIVAEPFKSEIYRKIRAKQHTGAFVSGGLVCGQILATSISTVST